MESNLIVFEGVDGCGKTSLSKAFRDYLAKKGGEWSWSKEPIFTSEEADVLNSDTSVSQERRERMFFESRLRAQKTYKNRSVILDRYIWTGMAYCLVFSPDCFAFSKELYHGNLFIKPDLYIYVDTPVDICLARREDSTEATIKALKYGYSTTKKYLDTPVITVTGEGSIDENLKRVIHEYESFHNPKKL